MKVLSVFAHSVLTSIVCNFNYFGLFRSIIGLWNLYGWSIIGIGGR